MREIERVAFANGGVISAAQLRDAGVPYSEIKKLRGCSLDPIRKGWYRTTPSDAKVVSAVKQGGVLSCVSALRRHGVWVPQPAHEIHIRYPGHKRRIGTHCHPFRSNPKITGAVDPVEVAIAAAANCLDAEDLIVVLDSMLNKQMIDMADARTIVADSPFAHLRLADRCDKRADSGLETIVRLRLRALGIKLKIQVEIGGVGWVDILVGRWLVIETDGEEFHQNRQADYERDLKLHSLGYLPVRLSYQHVMDDWPDTLESLLAMIRRRDHLRGNGKGL